MKREYQIRITPNAVSPMSHLQTFDVEIIDQQSFSSLAYIKNVSEHDAYNFIANYFHAKANTLQLIKSR